MTRKLPDGYLLSLSGAAVILNGTTRQCDGCGRQVSYLTRWDKEGHPSKSLCGDCNSSETTAVYQELSDWGKP